MRHPRDRAAFTIPELLVVLGITMTLMGLILPGALRYRQSGSVRRGAQQFASMLLASQSLSLGSPTGAAVIVQSEGTAGECSATIAQARRYPFVEGVVTQGMPPANLAATVQTVRLDAENDVDAALVHGFKIRFLDRGQGTDGPVSEWFSLSCSAPPVATASVRSENNQTTQTVVWPTAATSGTLSFQVARYPIPAGFSQSLPDGVAIDLRHSGYEGMANWQSLAGRGAIGVGFDSVGSVDSLMQNVLPESAPSRTVQPITPYEQVYFYVVQRDGIEDEIKNPNTAVSTLASDSGLWVVVHPRTGRVTISPNVPQRIATSAWNGLPATEKEKNWRAARAKARQGIGI